MAFSIGHDRIDIESNTERRSGRLESIQEPLAPSTHTTVRHANLPGWPYFSPAPTTNCLLRSISGGRTRFALFSLARLLSKEPNVQLQVRGNGVFGTKRQGYVPTCMHSPEARQRSHLLLLHLLHLLPSFLLMREPTHRLPTAGRPNAASLPEPAPAAENVTPAVAGRRQKRDRWMDGHGWMDGEREKSLTSSPPARSLTSDVRPIKKIFSPLLLYSVPLLFPSRQLHTP